MNIIPYGRQEITEDDIDAVIAVLRSDFLTQGPSVPAFEKTVAEYCGVQHAVAVNSATSALHIACIVLGVGRGSVVWTSPISFVASANCALYCGANVDFVDIDPRTYNISIEKLAEKLADAKKNNNLPKVLIPVHLCGSSCDMESIYALSQQYGFKIIEDASHAIGGKYKDEPIGNCRFSDIAIFSFHPVKIITTGEGGVLVTNDETLANNLRLLRSHGITSLIDKMEKRSQDEIWNYQQIELGFNYRMTDIQAALGLSQMHRLDSFVIKRQLLAKTYNKHLASLPINTQHDKESCYSSYHLFVIRLKLDEINKSHRQVYNEMRAEGIQVNLHYIPIYRQPYYKKLGFLDGYCEEAERYYSDAISIPLYTGLSESQQNFVIAKLTEILA